MCPTGETNYGTPDLTLRLGGITLKNPILTASGTCGYGEEYAPFLDLSRLGGFTTKSVTRQPRPGNAPPRIVETTGGMINAIGLANVGLDEFISNKLGYIATMGTAVFVNVAGHCIEDYVAVCDRLDREPALAGFELNVSCPNVKDGLTFGTDAGRLRELVSAVRQVVRRKVMIVKLSPNVTDISATARAAIESGADALSLVNTFLGMAIDIKTWKPKVANESGGLSGPAIKPMALHLVRKVWREVAGPAGIPVIGMGGIQDWQDAVEFMLAGASAVSLGTALYVDPQAPLKVLEGLRAYLERRGLTCLSDLVGKMQSGIASPSASAAEG